jgi:hypothetical protein
VFKSAILFLIINPTYEVCFKPINQRCDNLNSNDIVLNFFATASPPRCRRRRAKPTVTSCCKAKHYVLYKQQASHN